MLDGRVEFAEVEREVRVAAAVSADGPAVDRHGRAPVDGAEVEEHVLAIPVLGHAEATWVPEPLVHFAPEPEARKSGLERERDEDLARPAVRLELYGPGAVQALPARAHSARHGRLRTGNGLAGHDGL